MAWRTSVPSTLVDRSGAPRAFVLVPEMDEREIKAAPAGRSFRQFDPSKDAPPREGMIVEFFDGVGLGPQYSERGRALGEWEIVSSDYRIEQAAARWSGSAFASPRSERSFPAACTNCVESPRVSVAIQDVFHADRIRFRVDDLQHGWPSPFPGLQVLDPCRGRHRLRLTRAGGQPGRTDLACMRPAMVDAVSDSVGSLLEVAGPLIAELGCALIGGAHLAWTPRLSAKMSEHGAADRLRVRRAKRSEIR